MAIFHLSTKPLSRSSGRSAVAAAAYRSGTSLTDERQGLTHDYERRSGVEHSQVVTPEGAGEWSRQDLWNAAEAAEKRKDARTGREWEVALPDELNAEARQELAVGFAEALCERFGCAVDVAIHAPGKGGDQRNWHAHLLATTRQVTATGLGEKCSIELSDKKRLSQGLGPARTEVESMRQLWEKHVNQALERAGRPERVNCQSLEKQKQAAEKAGDRSKVIEFSRAPQTKLGWKAAAMERRGVKTYRGDHIRKVKAENQERKAALIEIDEARKAVHERREQLAGFYQQAEKELRDLWGVNRPSKAVVQNVVARWRRDAENAPNRTAVQLSWEKDPHREAPNEWRRLKRELPAFAARRDGAASAMEDLVKGIGSLRKKLIVTGVMKRPPKLDFYEKEFRDASAGYDLAAKRIEALEKIRDSEVEHSMKVLTENHQKARNYMDALEAFPVKYEALLDEFERAYLKDQARRRERDRGKELG